MEYSKIIAITGLPGLFELISSKSDGGIVRSLDDKSTRFVSSRVHQFSHLESIEVYTTRHNVNLVDILKAMESSKEKLPDDKEASALKSYFEKVYPELDFDRVYTSVLYMVLHRTGRSGQHYRKGYIITLDLDVFDHVQRHNIFSQIGLLHIGQGR